MPSKLVIVESPAKARTLGQFLGKGYQVKACLGHVRDLPKSKLGVDVDNGFLPKYVLVPDRKDVVKELKSAAQKAHDIYLATDPDREGEAISWHLLQALEIGDKQVRRVAFHEITPQAVAQAFHHPRDIDLRLVEAQQARRILDRLVGYRLSPILWQKIRKGLSAGRVQSAALRLVADREREIEAFVREEYWLIEAELSKLGLPERFRATLSGTVGQKGKLTIGDGKHAEDLARQLRDAAYQVGSITRKAGQRSPSPPFITSTLQQEAWRKLHFSAQRTMAVAQQLYEGLPLGAEGQAGLITYMRTDSTHVATQARDEFRDFIEAKFGKEYVPPTPRVFRSKVAGAQEAHEAIRPTSAQREPDRVRQYLNRDQTRLYELIWKRMVASQMANARVETTTVEVHAKTKKETYLLKASGTVVKFPGFFAIYQESKDEAGDDADAATFPPLEKGEPLELHQLSPNQKFTQPPPRYTEASLIKALEEKGIGRPSTYAPTMTTLQTREYVERLEGHLKPTALGLSVNDLLTENFPRVMDLAFTAQMEEQLDDIAEGKREREPVLREFYAPFDKVVTAAKEAIPKVVEPAGKDCPNCGRPMIFKYGRFGKFISCSGYPECKTAERIGGGASNAPEPAGKDCPNCGRPMVIKHGRFGKFISCSGFPECKTAEPLPMKDVGACPQCGGEVVQRRSKKKRVFWGCRNYPQCNFTTFRAPLSQPCPKCGSLVVAKGRNEKVGECLKCEETVSAAAPEPAGVA